MRNYKGDYHRLQSILEELRANCPWDKKQTISSLRHLTIEETYELAHEITEENWIGIKEELGDILLHILFYAQIAKERNEFTIEDVIEGICNKLVLRHPHIYDSVKVNNEEEVKQNWEKIKQKEKNDSILSGVPDALPALVKALRIQEKAKQVGFEWERVDQVKAKLMEELNELDVAIEEADLQGIENEFGDVLFSMINLARFLNIEPENALQKTNRKFISRFKGIELKLKERGTSIYESSLEEMEAIWNDIKDNEK